MVRTTLKYDRQWHWESWTVEPILLGMWTALASGSVVKRLPLVIPSLLLLCVSPGLSKTFLSHIDRNEFLAGVICEFAVFLISVLVFLGVHLLTRLQFRVPVSESASIGSHIRFDMKYLLTTMTLCAVLFAVMSQLHFRNHLLGRFLFGPGIYIYATAVSVTIVSVVVSPTIAFPLFVLRDKISERALLLAIAYWLVVTTCFVGLAAFYQGRESEPKPEVLLLVPLLQFGAAIVGIVIAIAMRLFGFRLVRFQPAVYDC